MKLVLVSVCFLVAALSAKAQTPGEVASARLASATDLSPSLRTIFLGDQKDRSGPGPIDMAVVSLADQAREAKVRRLLVKGAVKTGSDYEACAWVFQHSNAKDAQLLAHGLALTAMSKGRKEASWIAAASLDRYLNRIGQPQVYGTQYSRAKGEPWSQDPYNRDLFGDALRHAMGVEDQAGQARRLNELNGH